MKQLIACLTFFFSFSFVTLAQLPPIFMDEVDSQWADSLLNKMSIEEKVGQLFMIQAYSNKGEEHLSELLKQVETYHVGAVLFMQGSPTCQARITNKLQAASKIPLLIAMDAEWGLGFRLDSTMKYPVQMALGAINDDSLIYQMGYEIGQQCKRLGIHMNLAPVCDINTNPDNPVINYRSFGESCDKVAQKAWMYASGLQDAGIIATAKHFPGHGDTRTDSHLALPVVKKSEKKLRSNELFPFEYLIDRGIGAVMTGHLQVPAFEHDPQIPASLSSLLITDLLKKEFGYNGLIITDAMNMQGVTKNFQSGDAALLALKAGNDMIEVVPDLGGAIKKIETAITQGELSMEEIDEKCRKILMAKYWLGLDHFVPIKTDSLINELNKQDYFLTKKITHQKSLTVLENKNSIIPLQNLDTLKVASLSIGDENLTPFQMILGRYMEIDHFNIEKNPSNDKLVRIINELEPYNLVIIGIHDLSLGTSNRYGLNQQQIVIPEKLKGKKLILSFFGNPYALQYYTSIDQAESVVVTYQENRQTQELAAQLIFGGIGANGKLPVGIPGLFTAGSGIDIKKNGRLQYTIPEEIGVDSEYLESRIDSVVRIGIEEKAYPGCQILAAKDGKVFFHKCYGFLTYDSISPVWKDAVYDLASVTKIMGPIPLLMKLYDEKKITLDIPFAHYWKDFREGEKSQMTLREVLAHEARLQPWIPYWMDEEKHNMNHSFFRGKPSDQFPIRVSSEMWEDSASKEYIFNRIKNTELLKKKEYVYSDLSFYLFPTIIENITGKKYEDLLKRTFFNPIGASTITYNAYKHFPASWIVPTEYDRVFRGELLRGYVHDEGAAMMGGVSGHAGLFGTANDLAKMMQMYLQYGYYGGRQYFDSTTIKLFTSIQFPQDDNRRGLGFDKPYIDNDKNELIDAYPAVSASKNSFGHSGFTGTFTWADPDNQLLFIFLSNRVFPSRNNPKLYELNIRPSIHQVLYDAIKRGR